MSFLKKLFGFGGGAAAAPAAAAPTQDYKGHVIRSTPFKADGQWQLCGVITRSDGTGVKEHRFVRADKFSDIEQAHDIVFQKGRLIIDQQAATLFN